ncbi:MAG: hypothetical protein OXU36_09290 [Candidatus Poribacteria bacterium]|nr:hypothetical protein [Candidatus Poribacteria bacterium]
MAGQSIRILPGEFTKEQHHRLGVSAPDDWGRIWSYVGFSAGTYKPGCIVRDIAVVSGTVTTAAAKDTNLLVDSGEFANDGWLRGAIGVITNATGEGTGQVFQVIRRIDDDTLEIALITDASGKRKGGNNPGWETALTTSSTFTLRLPGRVSESIATPARVRGVFQAEDDLVVPTNEERYGWVLQRGLGVGDFIADPGGNAAMGVDTNVRTATSGQVRGGTAGVVVGYTIYEIPDAAETGLKPMIFTIENDELSHRYPIKDKPYSRDDNGELIL